MPATHRRQDAGTRSPDKRSSRVRQGNIGRECVELPGGQVPLSRLQSIGRSVPEVFGVGGRPTGWRDFLLFARLATDAARHCDGEARGPGSRAARTCYKQQPVSHSSERAGREPRFESSRSGHSDGSKRLDLVLRRRTTGSRDLCCALPIRRHVLPGGQLAKGGDNPRIHEAWTNAPQSPREEASFPIWAESGCEVKACGACILYGTRRRFGG
jgi:hypothetical protein